MRDVTGPEQLALQRDVEMISRIPAVQSMLKMVLDETGMGFAAVARVTDTTWLACAVLDRIGFGLKAGQTLELKTTLCHDSRLSRAPIVVDDFQADPTYRSHHTPAIYGLQSYISVPVVLPDGTYFGNLCAIHPYPAKVSELRVVRMFEVFAKLIAMQIDGDARQAIAEASLTDERASSALREQFIAVLGHDLRNPLGAVDATAEFLVRGTEPFDRVALGLRLKRTVVRMTRLIDDVLDFARGRLGDGIALTAEPVSGLDKLIRSAVDELHDAHPGQQIVSEISVNGIVVCDAARLQQVVSNLLGNAISHGARGETITLVASLERGFLTISVANFGDPIPDEVIHRIFEPYWRPPGSAAGGGLGLGLYICKQIVEAHGGTLTVVSNREDGTRFTALIPQISG